MTIAFQSERRRGLFVLQLARAGDYEAATTQKNDEVKKMAFFLKIQNTVNFKCRPPFFFLRGFKYVGAFSFMPYHLSTN